MNELDAVQEALKQRHQIVRELGRGVMTTDYLADDCKLPRRVAVRVLRSDYAVTLERDRFLREIHIAAQLRHPHIVSIIEAGTAEDLLYFVMPYTNGESVRDKIHREHQLGIPEAVRIAQHVAAALEYSHRNHIIHRDIKPDNILLHEGEAMVSDFGIALAVSEAGGERLTKSGLFPGTPEYMSPEQATDRNLDGRSDIYSLGCVLYEMLTGEQVFTGATSQAVIAKHQKEPAPSIRILRPLASEALEHVVAKALAKLPADRFATAAEFSDALAAI